MPTNTTDPPCLVSVADLETEHRIRNAQRRVREWLDAGLISQAGTYYPPVGKPVPLYSGDRALALANGER